MSVEYGSGTPGGHGSGDHAHEEGESHEHASGPGLCETRCPSRLTPNVSVGWNAMSTGDQPRLSVQLNVENVSNKMYLLSKESSMVQGRYLDPAPHLGVGKDAFLTRLTPGGRDVSDGSTATVYVRVFEALLLVSSTRRSNEAVNISVGIGKEADDPSTLIDFERHGKRCTGTSNDLN